MVTLDTVRPVVRLTLPKYRLKTVATWKVLKGTVKDTNGSGVARAEVRAVQKRATGWYAFRPASSSWVKAASRSARSKAGIRKVVPTATGAWTAKLPGLRKGTLSYRVVGVDKTGNRSLPCRTSSCSPATDGAIATALTGGSCGVRRARRRAAPR